MVRYLSIEARPLHLGRVGRGIAMAAKMVLCITSVAVAINCVSAPPPTASPPLAASPPLIGESPSSAPPSAPSSSAPATSTAAVESDRFQSDVAGFGLIKPSGWHFATVEMEQANRERVTLGNQQLDELVRTRANPSLVLVSKYPEPTDKLNPSIKVLLRPLGNLQGASPLDVGNAVVGGMKQTIPTFQMEGKVEQTVVSGLPASKVRARFSIAQAGGGASYDVLSRSWFVPRGPYLFIIAMSGPTQGEDTSETEFSRVLESITIRN